MSNNKPVVPYAELKMSKKEQVAKMFNNIAPRYDLLNRVLSLGIDRWWRYIAINRLKEVQPKTILDVATGTADVALATMRLKPHKVVGIDISAQMLELGKQKIQQRNLQNIITLMQGDAENLPFDNNSFDAITVAFGVRNFENLEKGLAELFRVLKPGGKLVVLEFSKPKIFPMKQLFSIYFTYVLPFIGKLISKDSHAYTYLPESVQAFPEGNNFTGILQQTGFKSTQCTPLTFGISSVYTGIK
ncbi:MAG TPA: bifunctional demethylmenaquinone methyltransferase/2-methoxy-6-polyprenyl-1,4-benzoquinol methylase UbiE [Chitinophagales bacterium]|nr:bifunctional demethylmenaquinone methyltransferase/2-methoxy-6-polyprenyl-1,4-benzoquinol methylase UbiE [Chitinophagales bacterium]HRK28385.1 bifunctional demethylmenaquinone methyltransferase/2-methoxy-6-polyprenyl-1,4-benzoquinol methylase UbiE [Chitinophagales bacterium]